MEAPEFLQELRLIDDDPENELSPHAMRVYVYLRLRSIPFRLGRPGRPSYEDVADIRVDTVAAATGMSEGSVVKGVRELGAKDIIDVLKYQQPRGGKANIYVIRPWREWRHYTNERSEDTLTFPEPRSYSEREENRKALQEKAERLRAQIANEELNA